MSTLDRIFQYIPLLPFFCLFIPEFTAYGQVDVKSQRDAKSSNGHLQKSGKFTKCLPSTCYSKRKKHQLQTIGGGFEPVHEVWVIRNCYLIIGNDFQTSLYSVKTKLKEMD